MPYKSDAQRRYFHAAEARGDIKKKTVDEFDQASKGKHLPEKLWEGGYAEGGDVESPIYEYEMTHHEMNMPPEVRAKYSGYADGGPVSPEDAEKIARSMGMPPKPKMMSEGGEVRYDLDEHGMHEYLHDQVNPDMSSEPGSRMTDHEDSPMPSMGYDREMTVEPSDENGKPDADDTLTRQEMIREIRRRKYGR